MHFVYFQSKVSKNHIRGKRYRRNYTFCTVDNSAVNAGNGVIMDIYEPTFSDVNVKARERFRKIIEKHIESLALAYDEYLSADTDRSERREHELEQFLCAGTERAYIYNAVKRAIHAAYPKPPKAVPVFVSRSVRVVKSLKEAQEKGLTSFAIIEEGIAPDVPEELKDPSIQWIGHSVTEIVPTLSDSNEPARLTYDGKAYYRQYD